MVFTLALSRLIKFPTSFLMKWMFSLIKLPLYPVAYMTGDLPRQKVSLKEVLRVFTLIRPVE